MDTTKLKKFATEARTILKRGVAAKMLSLGFDNKGHIDESEKPVLIQNGSIFRGEPHTVAFYHQWMSLYRRIKEKGIKEVYEEAAYTWFNRFMAIRILQKNGLAEPVLDFVDVARTPHIVDAARMGHYPQMSAADEERLRNLITDVAAVTPQFSLLITAYCHNNPILFKCFGGIADYTELLLPNDILNENGFIDTLNHTEFIKDEDFTSPELIGWLYQFYISERKDEVFDKTGKWEADEIPAATQIFTPNWIVKYMVQNTVGRIYLDNNPWADDLKNKWKYLVEPSEPTPDESKLKYKDLTELRVGDLACGSGHILNECFDLFFDLYMEDGYSCNEAVEAIFTKNLTGIDLDRRAKQLATFALLLKACQRDNSFADAHCMPNILDMPEPQKDEEELKTKLHDFFKGCESQKDIAALLNTFKLMRNADSLGSIMIFDIPNSTGALIKQTVEYYNTLPYEETKYAEIIPAMKLILALTEKYHALVMNPPYMGAGHMDEPLLSYIKTHYGRTSNDLGAVFMDVALHLIKDKAKFAMINQAAWFFKPAYKEYRKQIIEDLDYNLNCALYLGPGTFPELKGEVVQSVSFVVSKTEKGLTHFFHLKKGKTSLDKRNMFLNKNCKTYSLPLNEFSQIGGYQFGFWINKEVLKTFKSSPIGIYGDAKQGLKTGNNPYFLKLWFEISFKKFGKKWVQIENGGNFRKWYGNGITVINWENDGYELKNFRDEKGKLRSRPQGLSFSFKEGITWSTSAADRPSFRYSDEQYMFESSGSKFFLNKGNDLLPLFCAYFNSSPVKMFIEMLSPGLGISEGAIKTLPFILNNTISINFAKRTIDISKSDWDIHETSWDFKKNELLTMDGETFMNHLDYYREIVFRETGKNVCIDPAVVEPDSIEWCYNMYCRKWSDMFDELHRNEEELNRQFIDIYGLQDELTPDVPLNEVTILQQGEISIENNEIVWHPDVIIKQLISYAVGCWMGRYRLDKPGLHIAHPNPTDEEVCTYPYGDSKLTIDNDAIIPILPAECPFDDNLIKRIKEFIRIAFGAEKINQNINFVEASLGSSLEKYLQKDFWKDHKKMYQNRPIYWLFSSKKGAFQCLVYMHRMDANTADKVRSNYLMKHLDWLRQSIAGLEANAIALNTVERNRLKKLRNDLAECEEYNDRLQLVADRRISFDLDDGVVVNYAKFGDVLSKIK